jgi:peptide/nickel transport system substrate-binding protein
VASLATEIPQPEQGGRRYTIDLREGVKFHDGSDFNAEAVVFNFDRWRLADNEFHKGGGNQTSNFAYYTSQFGGFDGDSIIENVEAVDEYTVRFDLKEPLGPFLRNLAMSAFAIASPTALEKDVEGFWENPVGTGPFKFDSWDKGSEVRLTANKDWWASDLPAEQGGGGPNVDTIVFRSITDNSSRVASLAGGQLSGADGLTPDDVPTVEENEDLKVLTRPPLNIGYLALNCQKEPFTDAKVRRAMALAINMEEVVEAFFGDTAQVATNAYPPTVPFWREATEPYGYDPTRRRGSWRRRASGTGSTWSCGSCPSRGPTCRTAGVSPRPCSGTSSRSASTPSSSPASGAPTWRRRAGGRTTPASSGGPGTTATRQLPERVALLQERDARGRP